MVTEISCLEVWRELSNYVDENVDPELRARMELHFRGCKHCAAILDGTRNVIRLVGDGGVFELPAGFSTRLYRKLNRKLGSRRRAPRRPVKGKRHE